MTPVDTVILHGTRVPGQVESPRAGRPEAALWGVTRVAARHWRGALMDWTEWFDVHPLVETPWHLGIPERRPEAWAWYLAQDGTRPIWLQAPEDHPPALVEAARARFAQVPGAVPFPLRAIQAAFPDEDGQPTRWFSDQLGMQIAFALWRGARTLILNGVGVSTSITHLHAHRGTLYWLAFARGRGVRVHVEGPSSYHPPARLYAYEQNNVADLVAAVEAAGLQRIPKAERKARRAAA